MSLLGHSSRANFNRFSPERTPTTSEIMRTLEQLALDREEVILVGSAALALYGVSLYEDPIRAKNGFSSKPRPGDVDFVTTLDYAQDLSDNGTPSGLHGRAKRNMSGPPILEIATRFLPADIIAHSLRASKRDDDRFRQRVARDSVSIDGSPIRVATPQKLKQELSSRGRIDSKAASDLNSLKHRFPNL